MKVKITLLIVSAIIFVLTVLFSSCTRIDAGHEGILINQYGTEKGVSNVSLVTGTVWYNPFKYDVEEFPVYVQTIDYAPFQVNAKDGSVFTVDPTVSVKVIDGQSPFIYGKYRRELDEIVETTLYNYVRDAFRIQFNKYTTDSMISRRENFENAVQVYLENELKKEGFHLEQLTSGLGYPQTIIDAINAKNKAVQDAFRIDNEVKSTEAQARKKVAESKGTAEALIAETQGEAESMKLQADAQAYAYRTKQQNLTPLLLQQQFIEKWDGTLPIYGQVPTLFKSVQ